MAVEPDEFIEQPMEFYIANSTFSGYFLCLEGENIVGYARLGLAFLGKRRMSHRYGL